ncbi:hypothetical protein Ciccas_011151, partial [Cichlidogyrus casuarinus]
MESVGSAIDRPQWTIFLNGFSIAACSCIGMPLTIMLFYSVVRADTLPSRLKILMAHQTAVDFLGALLTVIKLATYFQELSDVNRASNMVSCYLWENSLLYWLVVVISFYGLCVLMLQNFIQARVTSESTEQEAHNTKVSIQVFMPLICIYVISFAINVPLIGQVVEFRSNATDALHGSCIVGTADRNSSMSQNSSHSSRSPVALITS